MSRNSDYTTWGLLDYSCSHNDKHSDIDFSRQTNTRIPQQINFIRRLEEDNGATMFSITEK